MQVWYLELLVHPTQTYNQLMVDDAGQISEIIQREHRAEMVNNFRLKKQVEEDKLKAENKQKQNEEQEIKKRRVQCCRDIYQKNWGKQWESLELRK